jgi:transposase InsO family protein
MNMSYSKNPYLPKVRADAIKMLRSGKSTREVARHFGFAQSTIVKWNQKVPRHTYQYHIIPPESSRPHRHPKQLSDELIQTILDKRADTGRGAEYIHQLLLREHVEISLSSVKRTLSRHGLSRYSKWKKWHKYTPRPLPESPGLLVQTDTIHDGPVGQQLYIYTLLDVHSRWAYAEASSRITANLSAQFVARAQTVASFQFKTIQSDHGPEFSKWFTKKLGEQTIVHRHSRVRTPNDNAHLERFNRTIQEECILRLPRKLSIWEQEIPDYLKHYNTTRPHMGINWKTPVEMLQK